MIAATFTGPSYFSPNHDATSTEIYFNLEEVIEALFDRYSSNGHRECGYDTLDGKRHSVLFPTVDAGCKFTCYLLPDTITDSNYSSDDSIEDVLTGVHGGHWDYTVTLVESEQGSLVAQVEKAGI